MERTRKVRKVSLLHCSSVCLGGLKNRNVGQEQMHLFCFSVTFQVNYYKQNVTKQRENERHRLLGPAALGTIWFPSLWRLWRRGEGLNSEPEFLHYVNNVDCRQGRRWGQEGLQIPALGVMLPSPLRYAASREDLQCGKEKKKFFCRFSIAQCFSTSGRRTVLIWLRLCGHPRHTFFSLKN